jgi:ABC-2 type transport system ATP-binding protein
MSIISLERVQRIFTTTEALKGVDLVIDQPQVIGLVGRNGAGKSTLLRLLPPLLKPSAGTVRVFDQDPWLAPEALRQRIGYVPDKDQFPFGMRALDLLQLCAAVYTGWDAALVQRFATRMQLDLKSSFSKLSRGQQRQVSLLCAIGHRPELLILDEPAGNLDPSVRRDFLSVLIELLGDAGSTVLLATHLFPDLERVAERIVILHEGKVIADGSTQDVTRSICRIEAVVTPEVLAALRSWDVCLHAEPGQGFQVQVLVLACREERARDLLAERYGQTVQVRAVQSMGLEDAFIYRTGVGA